MLAAAPPPRHHAPIARAEGEALSDVTVSLSSEAFMNAHRGRAAEAHLRLRPAPPDVR